MSCSEKMVIHCKKYVFNVFAHVEIQARLYGEAEWGEKKDKLNNYDTK
jgi:hypothetical protein